MRFLPAVVVVLVLLLMAMASQQVWALDFFHVAGGGLWTGIDLFVGFIIGPIVRRMSIPARMEFSARFMPMMLLVMPVLVTVTLASGWELTRMYGRLSPYYPGHWWLVASYIVVGVMAVLAIGVLEPANLAVLYELNKPEPDGLLIGRLMQRFIYVAAVMGVMQVATLLIMTRVATW